MFYQKGPNAFIEEMVSNIIQQPLEWHNRDVWLIFLARFIRNLSYGSMATILLRYLFSIGLDASEVGSILFSIMVGDLCITLYLTASADSVGRVKVLVFGSVLKLIAGLVFANTTSFYWLLASGVLGVINPVGAEIGPYLATEQAALTDVVVRIHMSSSSCHNYSMTKSSMVVTSKLADIFGYYNALGFIASAAGNIVGGQIVQDLENVYGQLFAFKMMFVFYSAMATCMIIVYLMLSSNTEADKEFYALTASITSPIDDTSEWYYFGLRRPRSRKLMGYSSILFALDAFAGGFVIPTSVVLWLIKRWDFDSSKVGYILSATSLVCGLSSIFTGSMVKRCGTVETIIYTQIPANVFVMLIPLMPTATSAVAMLVLRFSLSMMAMPATQAYVTTLVSSSERSAAGGISNVVRSLGLAFSTIPLAYLQSSSPSSLTFSSPFYLCGGLKMLYCLFLYLFYMLTKKPSKNPSKAISQQQAEEQPLLQN